MKKILKGFVGHKYSGRSLQEVLLEVLLSGKRDVNDVRNPIWKGFNTE